MTRDRFFIDFSLKVVLVIYPFCFAISALLFLSRCLVGLVFYTCYRDWDFYITFIAFSLFYIEKYTVVATFAYGLKEVLALDFFDERYI